MGAMHCISGFIMVHVQPGADMEKLVDEIVACFRSLHLRKLPTVPASNKWTQQGPCIDFVVMLILSFGILPALLNVAFDNFTTSGKDHRPAILDVGMESMESKMQEEVEWHRLNGARVRRVNKCREY